MSAEAKILNDKKLEYAFSNMADILNYSNSLLKDSCRMLLTKDNNEFIFIHRCEFLRKTQSAFFKLGVIELCKLFGNRKTNHFSFYKMESVFPDANEANISTMKSLHEMEVVKKIKFLEELRNQHFAHTDLHIEYENIKGKRSIYEIKFYFDDAFYLINLGEAIISELYEKLQQNKIHKIINKEIDAEIFLTTQLELLDKVSKYSIQINK